MAYLLVSGLVGACILLIYAVAAFIQTRRLPLQHGCQPLPHYRHKDPFFGLDLTIKTIRDVIANRNLISLNGRFQTYGPTFQTTTLGTSTIWSKDSELIQHTYSQTDKDWGVAPLRLTAMEPFCGRGFITTDGAIWEHSRALMKPTFYKSNISDLSFFETSTDCFLSKIPKDGSTIDLQPLLYTLFLDTATHFLFGRSLGALSGNEPIGTPVDSKTFLQEFHNSMQGMGMRIISGRLRFLIPKAKWEVSCATVHRFIDFFIDEALESRRARLTNLKGFETDDAPRHRSLLEGLIELTEDKVEIRNHLLQGMMAAQDTTSVLIANTLFLLSRSPSAWSQLRVEALGLASSGITFDSLRFSKVLHNILNESLRLYPIFSNLGRVALRDTVLPKGGGTSGKSPVYVAEGTTLIFSFYSLHRDSFVFGEDVESFNPDRWEVIKPGPWEYMVFGQGQRACLGQQKALVEASYLLVRMALAFQRIESRDDQPWAAAERLTTSNANGCKIALIPA